MLHPETDLLSGNCQKKSNAEYKKEEMILLNGSLIVI